MRCARDSGRDGEDLRRLHERVLGRVRGLREIQVGLGRDLLALRRAERFEPLGATTFPIYCEKVGLSAQEGRELAAMARAAEAVPEVEEKVASLELSVQKAATVAPLLLDPGLVKPGEDWLATAARNTTRELRDLVQRRREEMRRPDPPVGITLFVSRRGIDDFQRCRDLLSRKAGERLTEGQAFEGVCDDFLGRHDIERKARRLEEKDAGTRPPAPAADRRPGPRRTLTGRTQREVIRRFGDRCDVEGCGNRGFLQFAHLRPVRAGGPDDPGNLIRLCPGHHRQFDLGRWRPVVRSDGRVALIGVEGHRVAFLRTPGDPVATGPASPGRPPPDTG